jgi:hypothetical protein
MQPMGQTDSSVGVAQTFSETKSPMAALLAALSQNLSVFRSNARSCHEYAPGFNDILA